MAIQSITDGTRISIKNDSGGDINPYRCVAGKAQGTAYYPTASGKDFLGVSLKDLRYEDGVTGDGKALSVQTDGVVEIECVSTVAVFAYVKVSGTAGKVASAGATNSLSVATGALTPVVGIALEAGSDSRISVLLRPMMV
jgi:hypothetical protein